MNSQQSNILSADQSAANGVVERVYFSVHQLAVGEGDVRSRFKVAGFTLAALQERDFPSESREDFRWVMEQLTRHKSEGRTRAIEATMYRIKNSTGAKIATRILDIYSKLQAIRNCPVL